MQKELSPIKTGFPWIPRRVTFLYGDVEFDLLSLSLYFSHPNWDRVGDPVEHTKGRYVPADMVLVEECLRRCVQEYKFKPAKAHDSSFSKIISQIVEDGEMLPISTKVHGSTYCVYGPPMVLESISNEIKVAALCVAQNEALKFLLIQGQTPIPLNFSHVDLKVRIQCCEKLMTSTCTFNISGEPDESGMRRVNAHVKSGSPSDILSILRKWKPYFKQLGLVLDSMLHLPAA